MQSRAALVFALGSLGLVQGCFSADVTTPNGTECAAKGIEDSYGCEGQACLRVVDNAQGMRGICSSACSVNTDCSPHEACLAVDGEAYCFRRCHTDDDCFDKFVCRLVEVGNPNKFCLVDPAP